MLVCVVYFVQVDRGMLVGLTANSLFVSLSGHYLVTLPRVFLNKHRGDFMLAVKICREHLRVVRTPCAFTAVDFYR